MCFSSIVYVLLLKECLLISWKFTWEEVVRRVEVIVYSTKVIYKRECVANFLAFCKLYFSVCSTHLDSYVKRIKLAMKYAGLDPTGCRWSDEMLNFQHWKNTDLLSNWLLTSETLYQMKYYVCLSFLSMLHHISICNILSLLIVKAKI